MLTCLPQSICSWDFRILGTSAGPAALTFNFLSERGTIALGATEFTVRKSGPLKEHWSLEREGEAVGEARKPRVMFRSFEVRVADDRLTVRAQSAFTRSFEILAGERVVGTIRPVHAFTRRACIECDPEVSELAQLFSFWLVVLTWRRDDSDPNPAIPVG